MTQSIHAVTAPAQAICDLNRCILALDLGTTTGWALRGHGLITSGTASFRPGRFDGGGMRYLRFTNWLTEIDRLSGPVAAIWFEEVRRHAGTDADAVVARTAQRGSVHVGELGTCGFGAVGVGVGDVVADDFEVLARGVEPGQALHEAHGDSFALEEQGFS